MVIAITLPGAIVVPGYFAQYRFLGLRNLFPLIWMALNFIELMMRDLQSCEFLAERAGNTLNSLLSSKDRHHRQYETLLLSIMICLIGAGPCDADTEWGDPVRPCSAIHSGRLPDRGRPTNPGARQGSIVGNAASQGWRGFICAISFWEAMDIAVDLTERIRTNKKDIPAEHFALFSLAFLHEPL